MTKKPENIDTYKDGRGAPITESSAHYMNEHGDTFTDEQIDAAYREMRRHKDRWPYQSETGVALRLWLQVCAERDALMRQVERLQTGETIESDYLNERDNQLITALNERDDALKERDEWKLKFHLGIDDALAARKERDAAQERMREFAAQKAHFMAERDDALVRVREWARSVSQASVILDVRANDQQKRIAALEAELEPLRRLRAALDQPGLEDLGTLDLLAMLRAALKGEGDEV